MVRKDSVKRIEPKKQAEVKGLLAGLQTVIKAPGFGLTPLSSIAKLLQAKIIEKIMK